MRNRQEKLIQRNFETKPVEKQAQQKIDFFKSEVEKFEKGDHKTFESKNDYKIWKTAMEDVDKCVAGGTNIHVSTCMIFNLIHRIV